jgi:hypothetical protein
MAEMLDSFAPKEIEQGIANEFRINSRINSNSMVLYANRLPAGKAKYGHITIYGAGINIESPFTTAQNGCPRVLEEGRTVASRLLPRYDCRTIIRIPCQIIRRGRRIIYRVLGYNSWLRTTLTILCLLLPSDSPNVTCSRHSVS